MQAERYSVLIISESTLRRVQCIQKRHKLILDLFNSKIKDSFVVTTILSLNTLLISLDIYYMNKMLRYFQLTVLMVQLGETIFMINYLCLTMSVF